MTRRQWIFTGCGAMCLLGLIALLVRAPRRALELKLLQGERVEIIDDTRNRMWLVTLMLTNSTRGPVVFESRNQPLEIQVDGQWQSITNTWPLYRLGPAHERSAADSEMFLLPPRTHACRLQVRVNYQHEALSFQFFRELGRRGRKPGEPEMSRAIRGQQILRNFSPRLCDWMGQTNRYPQQYVSAWHWTSLEPEIALTETPTRP